MQRFIYNFLKGLFLLAGMMLFSLSVIGLPILMIDNDMNPVLSIVTGFIIAAIWLAALDMVV